MELEEAIKDIKRICEYLKESDYMSIDKDTKISLETLLTHLTKQEKMIQKIHENFCKFDWKNSNGEQVHNSLKELYESIFKNEESK
jgi:hypothetical protein